MVAAGESSESDAAGIRHVEHTWIPMPDGTRLSARIWLPEDAVAHPVPAILEYIPYRKRDVTRRRDDTMHPYFAAHGYASVRVDLRGSGDSEGLLLDEYLPQELDDGVEVIRWLAAQAWCSGRVGMYGISWGGFNGLQIAALQPEPLGAVISVCSTDDRYADDVHYMGGCLLGDNLSWASTMYAFNSLPPDPAIVGDRWRGMWRERLEANEHWLVPWLEHQHRDHYWRHGSICEDVERVQVPVMAVSGWADGYSNAVFRLLERLPGPRLGIVGPWSHTYPHLGVPGPAIGFLQEALRWWDRWLKDVETGITAEPMLRVWMLDSMPPAASYHERSGRWIGEPSWPAPSVDEQVLHFGDGRLRSTPDPVDHAPGVSSPLDVGLSAGKWCSYGATPDLPRDQRDDDGGSLVFTGEPLSEPIEILGAPVVELTVRADRPVAMLAVRLIDVQPDDRAARVTYGLLNLTHRDGHAAPRPLEPGREERIRVRLNDVAQRFPVGHRLRISVSTSYFPLAWPSPEPVRLVIDTSESLVRLPVRRPRDGSIGFEAPVSAPTEPPRQLVEARHEWRAVRDLARDESMVEVLDDAGTIHLETVDTTLSRCCEEWYTARGDDPTSASGRTRWSHGLARDDWSIRVVTETHLTCDAHRFHVRTELDAYEHGRRVASHESLRSIARDLV